YSLAQAPPFGIALCYFRMLGRLDRLHRLPGARLNRRRGARNQPSPVGLQRFLRSGVENGRGHVTASGKSAPESKKLYRSEWFQAVALVPLREFASPCAPLLCECAPQKEPE